MQVSLIFRWNQSFTKVRIYGDWIEYKKPKVNEFSLTSCTHYRRSIPFIQFRDRNLSDRKKEIVQHLRATLSAAWKTESPLRGLFFPWPRSIPIQLGAIRGEKRGPDEKKACITRSQAAERNGVPIRFNTSSTLLTFVVSKRTTTVEFRWRKKFSTRLAEKFICTPSIGSWRRRGYRII